MSRSIILSLFLFLGPLCALASADKIYLKDGRVVEGNILTSNGMQYYVAVEGAKESARIDFSDVETIVLNAQSTIQNSVKKSLALSNQGADPVKS